MHLPIGLASPLWLAFGAAAASGVAYWWLSRLGRPTNIEARKPGPEGVAALAQQTLAPQTAEEAVSAPAAATDESPAAAAAETGDDLTSLKGIGPRIAEALKVRGVATFEALAAWTEADLETFDAELNLRGRGRRDDWLGQARARLAA